MNEILYALVIGGLSFGALMFGAKLARQPGQSWAWVLGLAFLVLLGMSFALHVPRLAFHPAVIWLTTESWLFITLSVCVIFGTLGGRCSRREQTRSLYLLAMVVAVRTGLLPVLAPLTSQAAMAELPSTFDVHGVCLQNTPFTCGPAATVTALRQLGIETTESEMAICLGTNRLTGTPSFQLAKRLRARFASAGLEVTHGYLDRVEELKSSLPALVVVKHSTFLNHYVAVLAVEAEHVVIGDPLTGRRRLLRELFEQEWLHETLLLKRSVWAQKPNQR